jgi:RimJ/RimL family protein N-acetyltransferase
MSQISIRPAHIEDAGRIAELVAAVASRFIFPEFTPEGRARVLEEHAPDSITRRMAEGFRFHVAEMHGELVGVVGVGRNSHLFDLFVAEAHQGRGLGRRLWEVAMSQCLALGNPGEFTVNSSKYAVPVYQRFGFVATGPLQEKQGVQFVRMKLKLDPPPQPVSRNSSGIPAMLRTERLCIRRWRSEDAAELAPVLAANAGHLLAWLPERVAAALPEAELATRLAGFAAGFDGDMEWRFGVFSADERTVIGEVCMFPRTATGRVPFELADRLEVGYWLRNDLTGRGFATEAVAALLELAAAVPGMTRVEIHCDPRNVRSAQMPQRLGFKLEESVSVESGEAGGAGPRLMIWYRELQGA